MPQDLSIGCVAFCAEAYLVVVEATNVGTVDGNEKWNLSLKSGHMQTK